MFFFPPCCLAHLRPQNVKYSVQKDALLEHAHCTCVRCETPSHAPLAVIKTHAGGTQREAQQPLLWPRRVLLPCRCALYLANLGQWEPPARSCAADMSPCLTRLQRWHEGSHWRQVNAYSHSLRRVHAGATRRRKRGQRPFMCTCVCVCAFKQDPPPLRFGRIKRSHLVQGQK